MQNIKKHYKVVCCPGLKVGNNLKLINNNDVNTHLTSIYNKQLKKVKIESYRSVIVA